MEQLSPRVLQLTREYISHGYGYDLALEYAERVEKEERRKEAFTQRDESLTIQSIREDMTRRYRRMNITTPRRNGRAQACEDHLGNQFSSIKEMCAHWNISTKNYLNRRRTGWSLKKILTTPIAPAAKRGIPCTDHTGREFKSQRAMCKHYKITPAAFRRRIVDGWSLKRALVTPVKVIAKRY